MKRFLLSLIVILTAITLSAQVNPDSYLRYKGGNFYIGDNRISGTEIANVLEPELYSTSYQTGRSFRTAGIICMSAGSAVMVGGIAGAVIATKNIAEERRDDVYGSVALTSFVVTSVIGTCALVAGIPLLCIGDSKLANVANKHNHYKNAACLSFGTTQYGSGLKLVF